MNKQQKLDLLYKLKRVINMRADRRPDWFRMSYGLCANFENMCYFSDIEPLPVRVRWPNGNPFKQLFIKYVKTWPHYSGNNTFFIPAVSKVWPGPTAESMYHNTNNLYDRRSPYCKLRHDLLDHIIRCVEAE